MTRDPLAFLRLSDEDLRRLQRIRIVAMADRAQRECVDNHNHLRTVTEPTDTDFLLDLLFQAVTHRR